MSKSGSLVSSVTADPPASTCGRRGAGRLVGISPCCVFLSELVLAEGCEEEDEEEDDEEEDDDEDCAINWNGKDRTDAIATAKAACARLGQLNDWKREMKDGS
jgi:hypothetical protein